MLTLWKRHSATCLKKLVANKKLPADQRRFFKGCQCACWVTGTHPVTKVYIKESLGTTSWESGEKLKTQKETLAPAKLEADALTMKKALAMWEADKVRLGAASTTMRSYTALRGRILAYADDHGLSLLSQFTAPRVYDMVVAWPGKQITNAQRITKVQEFFAFAVKREWVSVSPAAGVDRPHVRHEQVEPYSPAEEEAIAGALDTWTSAFNNLKGGRWSSRPQTFKCLVHVLQDTGLRIGDALRVRPEIVEPALNGSWKFTLQMMKTDHRDDGPVTCFLTPETVAELKACPRLSKKYPFMEECGRESDRNAWKEHVSVQAQSARVAMTFLGRVTGVKGLRPHRFRHTFAVKKLIGGWQLEDVSRLLGHAAVSTTEKYYAKWTKGRQERLEERVTREWQERGIVAITRPKRKGRAA